ncbi:MAG: alanine racemase [Kiritimatiellaeota bacterium]|nr:alanine racemase [Kiritimatiellota bacterium]
MEVDLRAIAGNFRTIAERVSPLGVIAVLKADAYGLGARMIAEALCSGVPAERLALHSNAATPSAFAVAELSEAMEVVGFGLPVLILGTVLPDEIEAAVEAGVRVPVAGLDEARAISEVARRVGKTARCHVVVDTGMGRIGVRLCEARETIPKIIELPGLVVEGMYSHFPCANDPENPVSEKQVEGFKGLCSGVAAQRQADHRSAATWLHIANSDGINNVESALREPFTHVRTGLNLYGLFDTEGARTLELKPALALKARLAQVRELKKGDRIGYGGTYECERDMRVGTVAAGYADGLPLALSNKGALLIRGKRCPVIGRVSMDYTTVSLENCAEARAGDVVFCFGGDSPEAIQISEWAALKKTHPYEVICSIGRRVRRVKSYEL